MKALEAKAGEFDDWSRLEAYIDDIVTTMVQISGPDLARAASNGFLNQIRQSPLYPMLVYEASKIYFMTQKVAEMEKLMEVVHNTTSRIDHLEAKIGQIEKWITSQPSI